MTWAQGLALASLFGALSLAIGLAAVRTRLRAWIPADGPDAGRKLQSRPMPLVGGPCLAIAALAGATLAPFGGAFLLGLCGALAVGFLDDRNKRPGLAWTVKLGGQTIAASAVLLVAEPALPAPLAVLWLVLTMNAWNFLDNTDGVVAATGLGVTLPLLLLGPGSPFSLILCVLLVGFLVGFLPLNWPTPSAYLGDAGSHGVGFALGWLSLELLRAHGAAWMLAVHVVPLVDMAQVVAVRAWLRIPPWRGDRRHLAHRLQSTLRPAAIAPIFLIAATALTTALVLTARG